MTTFKTFLEEYESSLEYIQRLTQYEIKKLGRGVYSHVFQHPDLDHIAVKIPIDDPAYLEYVRFCSQHKDNPWLPKIEQTVPVVLLNKHGTEVRTAVVFLEKLEPLRSKRNEVRVFEKIMSTIPKSREREELWDYFSELGNLSTTDWRFIQQNTTDKHLKQALTFIITYDVIDLHDQNVMLRGTQPVLTDPLPS